MTEPTSQGPECPSWVTERKSCIDESGPQFVRLPTLILMQEEFASEACWPPAIDRCSAAVCSPYSIISPDGVNGLSGTANSLFPLLETLVGGDATVECDRVESCSSRFSGHRILRPIAVLNNASRVIEFRRRGRVNGDFRCLNGSGVRALGGQSKHCQRAAQ
jgi:hypothetical protein